jgi:hypothetical protein
MILYQIAMWQQKRISWRRESMTKARLSDLDRAQKQNARFYLAGFYADARDFTSARNILIALLREDPSFQPAKIFLQKLGPEVP